MIVFILIFSSGPTRSTRAYSVYLDDDRDSNRQNGVSRFSVAPETRSYRSKWIRVLNKIVSRLAYLNSSDSSPKMVPPKNYLCEDDCYCTFYQIDKTPTLSSFKGSILEWEGDFVILKLA